MAGGAVGIGRPVTCEDPNDPVLLARVENLEWLLSCGVSPARAAVQAGWISAKAAVRHLYRVDMDELATRINRDVNWSWDREAHALPGQGWKLHDERVSA